MPDPTIWPIVNPVISFAAVTGASAEVLAANANRADADFTNDSTCVIYLSRGEAAVIGSGIRLNPKGGSYHIGTNNLYHGAVFAISDGDEQDECNLAISEGNQP